MTKNEAIAIFERAGYTYTGYKNAGWGEKLYHFTHPNIRGEDSYHLGVMRSKARTLDIRMWHDAFLAELKQGIQQELFSDWEVEENYAILNPVG